MTTTCLCGCGEPVTRRFKPGHDARLKGRLLALARTGDEQSLETLGELGWLYLLDGRAKPVTTVAVSTARETKPAKTRDGMDYARQQAVARATAALDLTQMMKDAASHLRRYGRYGRSAGERRIPLTTDAEHLQRILDTTCDEDFEPLR